MRMQYYLAAAAVCLLLCGSGTGLYLADRLHRQAASLQKLVQLCVRLEGLLGMRLPTAVLTDMLVQEHLLPQSDDPWDEFARCTGPAQPARRELAMLIGRGDADSQIAAVQLVETSLRVREREAREDAQTKGKLYSTLGLIGGLLAAVLCI